MDGMREPQAAAFSCIGQQQQRRHTHTHTTTTTTTKTHASEWNVVRV